MNLDKLKKEFSKFIDYKPLALLGAMKHELHDNGYSDFLSNVSGYLYAKGNVPILLVAHVDTVFRYEEKDLFCDPENRVLWSPDGAGFDDRAGVLAIKHIVKQLGKNEKPHILLTLGEETGGTGAIIATRELPFKNKFKYIIELDRRGHDDCVFYECYNPKFIDYVQRFGFHIRSGSFSDISFLAPEWGIGAVNLSIGYYNEHSYGEYLMIDDWLLTIDKVIKMIKNNRKAPYFKFVQKNNQVNTDKVITCACCGLRVPSFNAVSIVDLGDFCEECYYDFIATDWIGEADAKKLV